MIYVYSITTPANTLEAARQKTVLLLQRGRITHVEVQFPAGQLGLVHVALNRGLHQLFPSNPTANFASSNETIAWDENYLLVADPVQLEAYTWNLDATYDHTVTVRVVMEAVEEAADIAREIAALLQAQGETNA